MPMGTRHLNSALVQSQGTGFSPLGPVFHSSHEALFFIHLKSHRHMRTPKELSLNSQVPTTWKNACDTPAPSWEEQQSFQLIITSRVSSPTRALHPRRSCILAAPGFTPELKEMTQK